MGAGSGVELANGCQRKQSGGPPASRALSWDFHPSGTGPGQRPRAGQGPCRGPATAPLAGASQAPWRQGEGWGQELSAPAPEVAYSLGDPGPSCPLTGLPWPHLYSGLTKPPLGLRWGVTEIMGGGNRDQKPIAAFWPRTLPKAGWRARQAEGSQPLGNLIPSHRPGQRHPGAPSSQLPTAALWSYHVTDSGSHPASPSASHLVKSE